MFPQIPDAYVTKQSHRRPASPDYEDLKGEIMGGSTMPPVPCPALVAIDKTNPMVKSGVAR